MAEKGMFLNISIQHNLDDIEKQLDRIIDKAQMVDKLVGATQAPKLEVFLDGSGE